MTRAYSTNALQTYLEVAERFVKGNIEAGSVRCEKQTSIIGFGYAIDDSLPTELDEWITTVTGDTHGPEAHVQPSDGEALILVDSTDREIGFLSKHRCHEGRGVLHRAFSLWIFNERNELLLQQRSAHKRLWPLYWSNSCCSHPRRHETMEAASKRRLSEELGISCPLQFLFKFEYQAQFDATGAEHELCSVFVGRTTGSLRVNRDEIQNWRWISQSALQLEMDATDAEVRLTPWFRLEWAQIRRDHRAALQPRMTLE